MLTHQKHKAVDFGILKIFGSFVILGVFFGSFLAAFIKTKYLVLFFSVVVFIFGAYLLLQQENIKKILSDKKAKFLEAVNMNSPLQTVIAGNTDEIESVKNELKEKGAKKVIDLSVSVPSHSSLMRIATSKLKS